MPRIQIIIRSMLRNPGLTLSAVLALALGIGANTALFTVINSLALHPYPLPEANRMIALLEREPNDKWPGIAPADYFDVVHQSAGFADVAAWRGRFSTLTDVGATDQIWSVEITEHLIGVMPRGFLLPGYLRSDIFLPFRPSQEDRTNRTDRGLRVCALLKPSVSFQQAVAVLQRVTHNLQKQWPRDAQGREIYAKPFRGYISEENRDTFLTLLAVCGESLSAADRRK